MTTILGIDPGSRTTGYGLIETDGPKLAACTHGGISPPAKASLEERLVYVWRHLCEIIEAHEPQAVAIEEIFHSANTRSALVLGHVRGVALLAASTRGCDVFAYSPAEVKKSVVGYGRADKHQVQVMVRQLLGLASIPHPVDAADALAVAICHASSVKLRSLAGRLR